MVRETGASTHLIPLPGKALNTFRMKAALVTPLVGHLPLYPSSYLGYGAAVLSKKFELDIIDLNADIYFRDRDGLEKVLFDFHGKRVILDFLDFRPLYRKLLNSAKKEYRRISWRNYPFVFITMPSWFVNIPTENILHLSNVIHKESSDSKIFFFGNSPGSWTDENRLRHYNVNTIHLNDLFEMNPINEPVDYDSLPTPIYEKRQKYIFDILPFRLKHGCIWGKCGFCSLAKGWNSGYKERSAEKAFEEIEAINNTYNPKMLHCNDNSVNGSNLLQFCKYFEKIGKPWVGMARADMPAKDIEALEKSGCKLLYFGLESGSDRVLQEINKGINSRQISSFIKKLQANNIIPAPSLFVGAPGETEDDFEKTIQFVLDHQNYFDILNVYPLIISPASDFSFIHKESNTNTLSRLNTLINVCDDVGLKVCVGEQSGEYVFCEAVYPGN